MYRWCHSECDQLSVIKLVRGWNVQFAFIASEYSALLSVTFRVAAKCHISVYVL